ncbi:MAG: HEAT repeat domain-containing protein [Planctomycetota bacterium]|jgi:hypothetical protein
MNPKSAILMACVGLACGAVGLGLGASWRAANQADPGPRAPRSEDGLRAAQLMLELDAARARASSLQRQIDAMPPAEPSSDAAPEQAERKPAAGDEPDELPVPEAILEAATATGVTPPTLRTAMKARKILNQLVHASLGTEDRGRLELEAHKVLTELKAQGEEGYLAVLALLRGGEYGIYYTRMLKETWAPGWERHLLGLVGDAEVTPLSRSSALAGLGVVDTPEVRRFLLDYLERAEDPGLFHGAANALGTLGETEGARHVRDKLHRRGWEGRRPHLLVALGSMGGDEAKRVILEYLDDPRSTDMFYAVSALLRIDPAAAAEEAAKVLDGPRAKTLSKVGREWMERWAGR